MKTLICGSIAFDTIMTFPGQFKDQILPDKVHILNTCFLVPEMRREFGGCAGNIAYNLQLLGGKPYIMATVGKDAEPYLEWIALQALPDDHILTLEDTYTAQAFITTDKDNNQITAFHPGAMQFSHLNRVDKIKDVKLGIVAPDGYEGMLQHARHFADAGTPFIFDPGQGLPMFSSDELLDFFDLANYVALNDYEAQMVCERTGQTLSQLATEVDALIVTSGGEGSSIYTEGKKLHVPAASPARVLDPTGCGDAYRAGLLYGIEKGFDWEKSGRLGAVMGAIKIAHRGTQNHSPNQAEIAQMFYDNFNAHL